MAQYNILITPTKLVHVGWYTVAMVINDPNLGQVACQTCVATCTLYYNITFAKGLLQMSQVLLAKEIILGNATLSHLDDTIDTTS